MKNIQKCESIHGADVSYDDLLSSAGKFGRYQVFLFFSTAPFYIYGVFVYFSQLFMTEVSPNHWCWIPELENLTDIERRNLGIPSDHKSRFGYSQCSAFDANWTEVLLHGLQPNETWTTVPCRHGWEFNKTEIPYPTISSEMGWVCERDSYQATAQSVFFVGSIVGGFIIGWTADKYGRLPAAVASNMIGCAAGVVSIFARNFLEFTICRFFLGIAYDNCMMMVYLIVLEYVAPKYRTIIANTPFALFYTLGLTTLPWIALACGHWKVISLATSIPLALSIFAPFVIPESPRWLLSKGRIDETIKKILTVGAVNKKEIPAKLIDQFKSSATRDITKESESIIEILKRPLLRNMFICICLDYMCCMIVFDALVRSIGQLEFDFFLSFTLVSFTEFPSLLIVAFVLDLTGRKWLSIGALGVSCIFSILTAFIGGGILSVTCAVLARFSVNMACNTAMQWAAEMIPTPVRGTGASVVHICGYVATVISPFIVYLETITPWLPLVLVGFVAATGAIVSMMLPETAKKDMPHTFSAAEDLVKTSKFFDIPMLQKEH